MEQHYGIVVTNRFLIGDDDIDDPEDFIKETTSKAEKVKSPVQGKTKKQDSNKKKQEPDSKPRKEDLKDSRSDSRRGGRGGRNNNAVNSRPPRKGREGGGGGRRQEYTESVEDQENQAPNELRNDRNERPPRSFGGRSQRDRDGDRPPRTFGDRFGERPPRDGDYGDRPPRGRGGRGRGRGRGFGGRGEFRGKREFDRHSGSDKSSSFKPQDKREGGGNHNWGSFKDDVREANTNNTVETFTAEDWDAGETHDVKTVPDKVEGEDAPKDGEGQQKEEEVVEKEPEVQEMTLDEYKALQASSRPKQDFKLRQAGEGVNNPQWKKTYVLKKAPQIDGEKDKEEHEDQVSREKVKPKDQVDITVHFYDQPTRGGRGGRRGMGGGRGRGRGGRGGGRGGRSRSDEAHISLTDHNQFPSLDGN